jgi:TolB-like protein
MNRLNNNYLRKYVTFFLILFLTLYPGLKGFSQTKISQEVFAVVDFSNDTGDPAKDYLQRGLANSLVTSLGSYSNGLISIVERGQLTSLIREMGLSTTGVVDSSSAVKLGNALGATQIIVGGLVRTGSILRLNVRVINVKTSRLTLALSEDGRSEEELLMLIDKVAEKIINKINNSEQVAENAVDPVESFLAPAKDPVVVPTPKKENPAEVKQDYTWLLVAGGIAAALIITFIVIASKPKSVPVDVEPISNIPVATATPNSQFPSTFPTGGTSDFNFNIKF